LLSMKTESGIWSKQSSTRVSAGLILRLIVGLATPVLGRADGCFIFKWDKRIDINEPTQKAIIVHDAGREDVLLQVKYQGPLEQFGWLIPVPNLPKVEKGSMDCFYELSRLTQRHFGMHYLRRAALGTKDEPEVNVVEVKTVGAYEVAILSAQDAGSLDRWLKTHDYSIPKDKGGIIDDYIRKGWYFIAAKIQLNRGVGFKLVSDGARGNPTVDQRERKEIQTKLSSGELHPLLISFDTPKCVFPLRISDVNGKPSEVSLYVLSTEPLLNRFILNKRLELLAQRRAEWERKKPERQKETLRQELLARHNLLQWRRLSARHGNEVMDWSMEELEAMEKEGKPPTPAKPLGNGFSIAPQEVLTNLLVSSDTMPQCTRRIGRLKGKDWYLTKEVRTFSSEEMLDLEFEPAIPALAEALPTSDGAFAASALSGFGSISVPALISDCQSTNSIERINASLGLSQMQDDRMVEPLLGLLHDSAPEIRLNAVRATRQNWKARFAEPLIALFRDEYPEIRAEAANVLGPNSPRSGIAISTYLDLLKDQDPDVQACALHVLLPISGGRIPREDLIRLLANPRMNVIYTTLSLLRRGRMWTMSSEEVEPLLKHNLTAARVMGLNVLQNIADPKAVELALPLLRDTNSIVRKRVFFFFRTVAGENVSPDDPAKWEQWWAEHKATFTGHPLNSAHSASPQIRP